MALALKWLRMLSVYFDVMITLFTFKTFAQSNLAIHHTVVAVSNLTTSLQFYQDGIGLAPLETGTVQGDWKTLLGVDTDTIEAVFLGNANVADEQSGTLELAIFGDGVVPPNNQPAAGLFLISFLVDVSATIARLKSLGLAKDVQSVDVNGSTWLTVRDPDGTLVLLLEPGAI
ncbi:hypothetical protein J3F84DRAFT_350895 [Trichoderma pleuroticola]